MHRNKIFLTIYILSLLLRIGTAPLIFWFPLPAILLSFFLDGIDGEFASRKALTLAEYEYYDKALDLWWYTNAVLFSSFYFSDSPFIKYFLLLLFVYRLIGEVIFFKLNTRRILFWFPNFFEFFFVYFFIARYLPILWEQPWVSVISISLVGGKLFQEWWLHIAKLSTYEQITHKKKQWLEE